VLAQNRGAIALLHRLGEAETTRMGREVEIVIDLAVPETAQRDLGDILRSVAAGTVAPGRALLRRVLPRTGGPPDRSKLRDVIVVGTDGSPHARAAVRCAGELAPALGSAVHLVAVHWPLLGDREAMDAVLEAAAGELRARGIEVTAHARRGDPAASVMDVAEEERAKLILLGPHSGRGGAAARLLLGSVSETVAAHAPCDVMIVRERAA
jgi:nucleotide-binding universal stress UspA family protein